MEIWKDIEGYEGLYQISNLGRIKSLRFNREKILKYSTNCDGYNHIILRNHNSIRTNHSIHRLVCLAFIENTEDKKEVNHINGLKSDNRLINLEWCTHSENQKHAIRIGLKIMLKGEKNNLSKLTEKQVKEIKYGNKNLMQKEIAKIYKIHRSTILRIRKGFLWSHI